MVRPMISKETVNNIKYICREQDDRTYLLQPYFTGLLEWFQDDLLFSCIGEKILLHIKTIFKIELWDLKNSWKVI